MRARRARQPSRSQVSRLSATSRPVVDADETVAAPADGGKPDARPDHRRRRGHGRDDLPPPVEPRRRRAGIQAAFSLAVLPAIQKHVNDRVAHCSRGGERPCVITVSPDGAAPPERVVDRARHADSEAPEAAAERPRVVGLNDEMEMVVLHTEVRDPKPSWEDPASARRTAGKTRPARRQRTARPLRRVICAGCAAMCGGRARRRPFRLSRQERSFPAKRKRQEVR